MFWILLIIAAISWILIRFFSDWHSQGQQVVSEGGMQKKYSILVDWVLRQRADCRIVQETKTYIRIGASTPNGSIFIDIYQTFGKVTIQWISKNISVGNDTLEWQFDEHFDQGKIIERMEEDIKDLYTKRFCH